MFIISATADELRRAVFHRADELDEIVRHLRGPLGKSRGSLRAALDLVEQYPFRLRRVVDHQWARNDEPASRVQIATILFRHANMVAAFIEEHLTHGTRRELSETLVDEIRRELATLRLDTYQVVVSHGPADNYVTTFGDFADTLFGLLDGALGEASAGQALFAFFKMPRIEGVGVPWRPVLLGHEVAHVAVEEYDGVSTFGVGEKFDLEKAGSLPNPSAYKGDSSAIARALYNIATNWTVELLCDAYAFYRYGPAAVAGLTEYLISTGSTDKLSSTHPPLDLRLRLLLRHLGDIGDTRLTKIVAPWSSYLPDEPLNTEPWVEYLTEMFLSAAEGLVEVVAGFGAESYPCDQRVSSVEQLADRLQEGVPGRELIAGFTEPERHRTAYVPRDADVVNAVWLARVEDSDLPIGLLGQKALESLEFMRRWSECGGELPFDLYWPYRTPPNLEDEYDTACLSEELITQRLRLDDDRALRITPLVHRPSGAGIDLRLGNRFIVFRRTGTATFDPLGAEDDPRSIQFHIELSWAEQFVLHPQEVVLGASLEYLVFPTDLTGQVITRSSYGRLGLLSATAVQIHPGFHGCLTLELVNLSTIPITLTPGERIAQLVISRTKAVERRSGKYQYPIGPQFSRVRDDAEADVLRSYSDGQR